MVQKYSEKATSPKKKEKEKEKEKKKRQLLCYCVWLSGRMHIEERMNEGSRLQSKRKYENETKTNVTPEKADMTSANQMPGEHKFALLVAIIVNYG